MSQKKISPASLFCFTLAGACTTTAPAPKQPIATGPTSAEVQTKAMDEYIGAMIQKIRSNLPAILPGTLFRLKAEVNIRIDEDGRVLEAIVVSPSKRPEYDAALKEAIQKTAFNPPPMEMRTELKKGISISFCNDEKSCKQ